MSSISSMPMLRRMKSGETPALTCSLSVSWRVGGAGRVDRQALGVAHVGQVAEQLEAVDEALARLQPALDAKAQDGAGPLGRYFCARAWSGWRAGRGRPPSTHWGAAQEFGHALGVGCTWRSMRRLSVSSPCRNSQELNGDWLAPISRRICTRALRMKAGAPRSA
jgi:hypothetical protein